MKLTNWHEPDREAVQAFYSVPRQLWSWADMTSGANAAARMASEWVETGPAPKLFPVILPRVSLDPNGESNLFWYAIAFNQAQGEQLRSDLWAFLGPVATDFNRRRAVIRDEDQAEKVLMSWSGGPWIYRFKVIDNSKKEWIRAALERLRFVWTRRPVGQQTRFRTTEELLRDFHTALVNGDDSSSEKWLQELRDGGRLSAENLLFLQIERLAALGCWEELFLHPQWSLLRQLRRPRQVTARMIEALYRIKLIPFLDRNDAPGAITYVREKILPENGALFRNRNQASSPCILLAFYLAAAASETPQRDRVQKLLLQIPEATRERSFAETVFSIIANTSAEPKEAGLELAKRAIATNDYEGAWEVLKKVPPSVDSARMLLICAYEFDTPEAAQAVNATLESLSEQDRALVFKNNRRVIRNWDELKQRLGQTPEPTNWELWLARLDSQPDWPEAVFAARDGASLWSLEIYRANPRRVGKLADQLFVDRSGSARRSLRSALPHLTGFFIPDGQGVSEYRPIYCCVLMLTALTDDLSAEDFQFVETLLEAILEAGVTEQVYQDAVQNCTGILETHGSTYTINWALGILDILASRPSPLPAIRDAFFEAVLITLQREHRRVSRSQWEMFSWLCHDLGRSDDFAAIHPPSSTGVASGSSSNQYRKMLKGRTIAIYTLTESAGDRAKKMIEHMFSEVEVQVTSDLVGSTALRSLSRRADWFVVATRSAKHAATEFIKENRSNRMTELLYPFGKGASSIVSSLLKAIGAEDI
jgi:hypothetical protein